MSTSSNNSQDFATATAIITLRVGSHATVTRLISVIKELRTTNDLELVTDGNLRGTWLTVSGSRRALAVVLRHVEGCEHANLLPYDSQGRGRSGIPVTPVITACFQNYGLANWVLLKGINRYGFASIKDASAALESALRTHPIFATQSNSKLADDEVTKLALRACQMQIRLECAIIKHLDCPSAQSRLDIVMELAGVFDYVDCSIVENNPLVSSAVPSSDVRTFNRVAKLLDCGPIDLLEAIEAAKKVKMISRVESTL